MASIFELFSNKSDAEQKLESLKKDEFGCIEALEQLKRLQPSEYKSREESLDQECQSIQDELAQRLSLILTVLKGMELRIDRDLTPKLTDTLVDSSRSIVAAHLMLNRLVTVVDGKRKFLDTPSRQITESWDDRRWWEEDADNKYSPRTEGLAPMLVRAGKLLEVRSQHSKFSFGIADWGKKTDIQELFAEESINLKLDDLPLLLQCRTFKRGEDSGHIAIFTNSPETRQAATAALESIALRAIATFPARKLQGIFIDPVSMGNTFPFRSLPEEIRSKRTYTTSDDIQEELHKLIAHTEQVIQNYLSRDFDTIEDYNAAAEAIQEAYRYLFIADFPSKFDNRSFEYLNSLLVNGSKAGVYTIIHIDETLEKPRNFNYDSFKANCQILRPSGRFHEGEPIFVYESPESPIVCYATLDKPPESDRFNQLTAMITKACGEVKVDTVPFSQLYPATLWTGDSRKEIRAAIGVAGAREKLEFWLGENSKGLGVYQSLLFGKPGAGKSYTLHGIINGLAMNYPPDELEMYLLDFKEGVEFQVYVDPERGDDSGSSDEHIV